MQLELKLVLLLIIYSSLIIDCPDPTTHPIPASSIYKRPEKAPVIIASPTQFPATDPQLILPPSTLAKSTSCKILKSSCYSIIQTPYLKSHNQENGDKFILSPFS